MSPETWIAVAALGVVAALLWTAWSANQGRRLARRGRRLARRLVLALALLFGAVLSIVSAV